MNLQYNDFTSCYEFDYEIKIQGRDCSKPASSAIENLDTALSEVIRNLQEARVKLAAGSKGRLERQP